MRGDGARVGFQFQGELNDFLDLTKRDRVIWLSLPEEAAVKHPIEALGVPHPEVGAIFVDGLSVCFTHRLRGGEFVDVFPCAADLPAAAVCLRPPLVRPLRFVLDTHLGQLASYLRLLGFNTLYRNDFTDMELAQISADEDRLLLTRDRGLLKRRIVVHGHCVRATAPPLQLASLVRRYGLGAEARSWQRCVHCNGLLEPVAKAEILDLLQPKTRLYYDVFQRCAGCGRIYWQGSHYERMQQFLAAVLRG